MAEHLIVCGHGQGDPGAVGNGITEEGWTRNPLAVAIMKYAKQLKNNSIELYDTSKNMYTQTRQGFGAYSVSKSYSSVTECHLDAARETATGGHVIISSKYNPDANDLAIAKVVEKYTGWWGSVKGSQGINKRSNLLNLNILANRGISYRLVELGFITSKSDTDKLKSNVDNLAKSLVEAITGEKIAGTVTQSNNNQNENKENETGMETMVCLYKRKNEKTGTTDYYYFNGVECRYIDNTDTIRVLKEIYKANNGKDMPEFNWTNNKAPWWLRLNQVAPVVQENPKGTKPVW